MDKSFQEMNNESVTNESQTRIDTTFSHKLHTETEKL